MPIDYVSYVIFVYLHANNELQYGLLYISMLTMSFNMASLTPPTPFFKVTPVPQLSPRGWTVTLDVSQASGTAGYLFALTDSVGFIRCARALTD